MLHLFNKVYLEFDDKIEINFDRVVISEQNGFPMNIELDRVSSGELLAHGRTYDEVVGIDFVGFVEKLHKQGQLTNKKLIIYCDRNAYRKFIAQWFRSIIPALDLATFKTLVDYTIYKERVLSNTEFSSVTSLSMQTLFSDLGNFEQEFRDTEQLTELEANALKAMDLSLSYEFLIADYLSGSTRYESELTKTLHLFLKRFVQEQFVDNRTMVLINLTNYRMQQALGIDPESVDITKPNPLANIPALTYYADPDIWDMSSDVSNGVYGVINLKNMTTEQMAGLTNTLLTVFEKFEGMQTNVTVFEGVKYFDAATRDTLTKEELNGILDIMVNNPFDTCFVPRYDFENVNYPLMLHFFAQKKNKDLTKYRLL